jgi:hypothetical protein
VCHGRTLRWVAGGRRGEGAAALKPRVVGEPALLRRGQSNPDMCPLHLQRRQGGTVL